MVIATSHLMYQVAHMNKWISSSYIYTATQEWCIDSADMKACSTLAQVWHSFQLSRYAGTFPEILAVFQNGVIYEYAKGRHIKPEELRDPAMIT